MEEREKADELTEEDLLAALEDMKVYVDVTAEDLKKIYAVALRHARERVATTVPVRDIMTREVITATPGMDVREASRRMTEGRVSGLPVVGGDGRVVGIVSEADILCAIGGSAGHGIGDVVRHILTIHPHACRRGQTVGEVMSSPAVTATPSMDAREVAGIMAVKGIKRLPVVDDDGRLAGIVSRHDIVRAIGAI